MSPGKCISPPPAVIIAGRHSPNLTAQKCLNFGSGPFGQKFCSSSAGLSWADKVKGLKPTPTNSPNSQDDLGTDKKCEATTGAASLLNKASPLNSDGTEGKPAQNGNDIDDENDGWEIVARGKNRSRGSSTSISLKTTASQDSVDTVHVKIENAVGTSADKVIGTAGSAFEKVEKSSPISRSFDKHLPADEAAAVRTDETKAEKSDICSPRYTGLMQPSESRLGGVTDGKSLSLDEEDADNYEELILEAEMNSLMQTEEQQEEDMISRQMEEENEKALASAIEEEEHLTKELEDEALKNMDDEFTEDVSSDKEGNNTDEGQDTPRETNEIDEPVSVCF